MTGKRRISTRTFTQLGLALLGVALLGVLLAVAWPGPEEGAGRALWFALRLGMALVLLAGWALLNIPPPALPGGPFVLAVAELGEVGRGAGGRPSVRPAPRTLWDDFRASLPANLPIPEQLPFLTPLTPGPSPTTAVVGEGDNKRPPSRSTPRRGEGESPPAPAHEGRAGAGGEDATDASPLFRTPHSTFRIPTSGRAATAWLVGQFNERWAGDRGPPADDDPPPVADDVAFAANAAGARANARALNADVVLWGAVDAGAAPDQPASVTLTAEIISDLERRAAPGDADLRLAGLAAAPLGPLSPGRPELALAFVSGLAAYAGREFRVALNEWNMALIAARVGRNMAPPLQPRAEAAVQLYRGNAFYQESAALPPERSGETLGTAEAAYSAALDADPQLAAAHHNLALVYVAQGRYDKAMPAIVQALQIDPRGRATRATYGALLLILGQVDRATRQFERLAADYPADAEIGRALARCYRAAGRLDEAESAVRAAISADPGNAAALAELAAIYYERGSPAHRALARLNDAELDPLLDRRRQLQGQLTAGAAGAGQAAVEAEFRRVQGQLDALEARRGPLLRERQAWLGRARLELARALELRPNDPYLHLNLAVVLRDLGEGESAADEFGAAERWRPLATAYGPGLVWGRDGRLDRASVSFTEPTILRPASAAAFISVGLALQKEGRLAEAADQFQRVLYLDPANADANYRLGMLYTAGGQAASAALYLQTALAAPHDPPWPPADARNTLAEIYRTQGHLPQATALVNQVLTEEPRNARAHYIMGTIHRRQNRLDEAIAAFRAAIQYDPANADAHYNLGVAYVASGRRDEARAEFRRIAALRPTDPDTHVLVGTALKDAGEWAAARDEFERAIELDPDHVEAHYNLGLAYQALGQHDAALFAFRDVLRLAPDHPRATARLGMTYAATGRLAEAIGIFTDQVRDDPNNAEAYYNLGVAYQAQGDLPNLLRAFREVVRLRPADAEAFNTLGEAYRAAEQPAAAEAAFRRAIELRPAYPEPHYNLGRILTATNRTEEGVAHFRAYETLRDGARPTLAAGSTR